jgi:pimeloyl-ACP methyl ester carboxylesterase
MTGIAHPQHHIIYIPGLGDSKTRGQQFAVRLWRTYGVYGHCHAVIWNNTDSFENKLQGILKEIDQLKSKGHIVSLMGASAGASMALHAFAARKEAISSVVLVCGELADARKINPSYFTKNPAFKVSMERLPATLNKLTMDDRKRVMSLHPLFDETVTIKDTYLEGARMFTSISFGHAFTIGMTLTIDFYIPMYFFMKWAIKKR